MRYSPPSTVDISAQPVTPFAPEPDKPKVVGTVIKQSLGIDIGQLILSLLMGLVFSSAVGMVSSSQVLDSTMLRPPHWLIFLACALPSLLCLFLDTLSAFSNPAILPLARSPIGMKSIYAKRLHLQLLAFYFTAILVALCWSALTMPLISKLFVSAVFAFALYSLGQSIPSRRTSFIVSGILFLVVLIATQAFIVLRLEAESTRANQEALGDIPPRGSETTATGEAFPFGDEAFPFGTEIP